LKRAILDLLDENRTMSVATVRPDGWPQVTIVGYAHDDLTLYFEVARTSQKRANIEREPRVSIALGHHTSNRLRGLSMAANAAEVTDVGELGRLADLMTRRYPGQVMFSPRESALAVMRATPVVISIIDLPTGPGEPRLVAVDEDGVTSQVHNAPIVRSSEVGVDVSVNYNQIQKGGYRPDAPL